MPQLFARLPVTISRLSLTGSKMKRPMRRNGKKLAFLRKPSCVNGLSRIEGGSAVCGKAVCGVTARDAQERERAAVRDQQLMEFNRQPPFD